MEQYCSRSGGEFMSKEDPGPSPRIISSRSSPPSIFSRESFLSSSSGSPRTPPLLPQVTSPTSTDTNSSKGGSSNISNSDGITKRMCLCAPTTHVGSFRCRLHRSATSSTIVKPNDSSDSDNTTMNCNCTIEAQ